ncbi:MAG: hypothetical protein AAGD14_01260 [Planctomycetota bacterium]
MKTLAEYVTEILRERGYEVEIVSDLELLASRGADGSTRIYLDNLAGDLARIESAAERDEKIEWFLRSLETGESATLVVLVKSDEWLESLPEQQASVVRRPIAADMHAVLARDEGERFSFVLDSDDEIGEDPFAAGVEGVLAIADPLEMCGDALKMLNCGGDYEASMLLADHVWDVMADHVDGDVIAAAPARDLLFVTGADDAAGLSQMEAAIRRVFDEEFSYRISRAMLRRKDGGWVVERVV